MKTMNTLSKIVFATLLTFILSLSTLFSQNDTMYVMKSGAIIGKYNVNNQVDSVIFYKPTLGSTTTVTDYDGNVYNTVTIGMQVWMKENLKTTHYANGTAIPLVTGDSNWVALTSTSKSYCWYNDDIANKATYGALYTWAAVMNGALSTTKNPSGIQGVCPTGWHLPSDAEWTQMEIYLANNGHNYDGTTGGVRAKIAKSLASTSGWDSSSTTGSVGNSDYPAYRNKSGFTAFPGGHRTPNGTFDGIGYNGYWWISTEGTTNDAWIRSMSFFNASVNTNLKNKRFGQPVRCIMDQNLSD